MLEIKVGDKVKIKDNIPFYGGKVVTIKECHICECNRKTYNIIEEDERSLGLPITEDMIEEIIQYENDYFEVETITGNILRFERQCNKVDFDDPNFCVFKRDLPDGTYRCLAIIPNNQIKTILLRKGDI